MSRLKSATTGRYVRDRGEWNDARFDDVALDDLTTSGPLSVTGKIFEVSDSLTTALTDDAVAIPIERIQQMFAIITPTAARTKATPSATAIIDGFLNDDGTRREATTNFVWTVDNRGDAATNLLTFTLGAGAGVTIPTNQNATVGAGRSGRFIFTFTNVGVGTEAVTVIRANESTEGFTSNAAITAPLLVERGNGFALADVANPVLLPDDASAIPVAGIVAGHMVMITPNPNTAARTKALPAATAILDAFLSTAGTRPAVGRRIVFRITLQGAIADWNGATPLTLTAGAGMTTARTANLVIRQGSTAWFGIEVTGAAAVQLYRIDETGGEVGQRWPGNFWVALTDASAFRVVTAANGQVFNVDTTGTGLVTVRHATAGNPATLQIDGGAVGGDLADIRHNDGGFFILRNARTAGAPTIQFAYTVTDGASAAALDFFPDTATTGSRMITVYGPANAVRGSIFTTGAALPADNQMTIRGPDAASGSLVLTSTSNATLGSVNTASLLQGRRIGHKGTIAATDYVDTSPTVVNTELQVPYATCAPTAVRTITLPTAAAMVTDAGRCFNGLAAVGDSFIWTVRNTGTFPAIIAAGGATLTPALLTIPAGTTRKFEFRATNVTGGAEAVLVIGLDQDSDFSVECNPEGTDFATGGIYCTIFIANANYQVTSVTVRPNIAGAAGRLVRLVRAADAAVPAYATALPQTDQFATDAAINTRIVATLSATAADLRLVSGEVLAIAADGDVSANAFRWNWTVFLRRI